MRALFVSWQWPSHLFPMVPLGWALQAAGHEVRVASAPALATATTQAGLTAVAVGPDAADLVAMSTSPKLAAWHQQRRWPASWARDPGQLGGEQAEILENLGRKQVAIADAMAGDLIEFGRHWRPDLIVHDAVTFAGTVAAAVLGVPALRHMWGSAAPTKLELRAGRQEPLPEYAELFSRFGAEPVLEPAAWIDPCPPSMQLPTADHKLGVRYVPYNGPGTWPGWLAETPLRPRVCVTFGVTATKLRGRTITDLLRDTVAAVVSFGAEVVVAGSAAEREEVGELPPGARFAELLPLKLLLPTCSAIVHLGGAGSVLTAAACGVPQLAISLRPEQMLTGDQLVAVGAGRHLVYNDLAEEADPAAIIRAEVGQLLEHDLYRSAAAALSREIAHQPPPSALVETVQSLATGVPA